MTQKLKIISIALGLVIATLVIVYFYMDSAPTESATQTQESVEQAPENTDVPMEVPVSVTEEDTDLLPTQPSVVENTDGIHIMADGSIMNKEGKVLSDAEIQTDGTIKLASGTIVTPAFDLRQKTVKPSEAVETGEHVVVDIVGTDFEYDVKQVTVTKGDTVTINFKSDEGFHDWVVDELDARTKRVNEGGITSVTFVADTVGTFQYYCSVMSHRQMGMVGYLVVEES